VEGEKERLLCVHYCGGNLGAAFYSTETFRLDLLAELPDPAPDYAMVRALVHQVEPHHLLVSARQDRGLLALLRGLASSTNMELSSGGSRAGGEEAAPRPGLALMLRPGIEFGAASCRRRVLGLQVSYRLQAVVVAPLIRASPPGAWLPGHQL
jgi:hypothetical protein